jgi:7,8-dihydropterin-6-yl-methyl-4-(beta-D-ribofuranosyl)aminobenzene 5'-phosphate synthase
MTRNDLYQAEPFNEHALRGIARRKFIRDAALGGTALLARLSIAGSDEDAFAANVVRQNEKEDLIDIGELKSLKIKCLSETGWFDTSLFLEDIKASGGTDTDQYLINWDKRNSGGIPL